MWFLKLFMFKTQTKIIGPTIIIKRKKKFNVDCYKYYKTQTFLVILALYFNETGNVFSIINIIFLFNFFILLIFYFD
jgi:hypothetical protein